MTKFDSALDKIVAALILCLSIVFLVVSISENRLNGVFLSAIPLISTLVYLLLRKRLSISVRPFELRSRNRIGSLKHIVFIISLSLSIWILWNNLNYRPPVYFVLCLLAIASVIWDIFTLDETKNTSVAIVLFKVITLSIIIYAGIYYEFPGIYGVDPWWHNQWIQETVSLGHITPGQFVDNAYFLFPIFHLAAVIMHIVTGLSIYSSVFVVVSVPIAISSIFVFLIGKKLSGVKFGLLVALVVPLTDHAIERATAIIPMSLGFCFFSAILYLIYCRDRKRVSDSLLMILFSVALIFTHTIAALIMLLSLVFVFIGTKFLKKMSRIPISYESVSLTLILFFGATLLFKWMQTSVNGKAFFDSQLSYLAESLRYSVEFAPISPFVSNLSPIVTSLDRGGYLLLLGFAIFGALIYLHPKKHTVPIITLVLIAAVLFIIPTSFGLFNLNAILPERWFLFLYVPLTILAVQGILGISSLINWNVGKIGMTMLVLLAAIFMMITDSVANDDSPQIFNRAVRVGYTQSEITAIRTLADIEAGQPTTDLYYGSVFSYIIGYDEFKDMLERNTKVFVLRNYYLQHPEWNTNYVAMIQPITLIGDPRPGTQRMVVSDYMNERGIGNQNIIYINRNVKVYDMSTLESEP